MAKNKSIVVAGYYGFGNAGDELILRALVDDLRHQEPASEIVVLSQSPLETAAHFQVQSVSRWHPWEWIQPLWKARRFILGGGGLLQETTGIWNHAYYLFLVVLAKGLGCQTEVRGVGVDPIRHAWNRWLTRMIFDFAVDQVSVRDDDSRRALEAAGIWRRIEKTSDLVFSLMAAPTPERSAGKIALSVCPWSRRPGWDHDIAFLIQRINEQLHVPVELLVFFPAQDQLLAEKVASLVETIQVPVRVWKEPEDLLNWIGDYSLVIGMRYHALVLAALAEKAFIGWGYERKVRTLCRDFSQPIWPFERGWEADAVFRQIGEAWKHHETLPSRYRPRLAHWKSAPPPPVRPVGVPSYR